MHIKSSICFCFLHKVILLQWQPVLRRPIVQQIPVERVIAALPALPQSKQQEVKHIIDASIHTCNHRQFLQSKQLAVFKEELAFHQSVYRLQIQYVQDLFDAVR